MNSEALTQDGLEAIAADILNGSGDESADNNANENQDQVLMDIANEALGVEESSDPEPEASEEDPESDDTEETTNESDDDSPVEADDDEEVDDEPTDDISEHFEVDYDDAKDGIYPIKINGEVKMMKFGEIQNQLARAESASKKSQEANQRNEELDARQVEVEKAEAWAKQQVEASESNVELNQLSAHLQQLQTAYQQAAEKKDSHNMTMIRAEMDKYGVQYQETQHKVQTAKQEEIQRTTQAQNAILKEKGYGDIITDAYRTYATDNLSEAGLEALNLDATLVIALEKARKWDASKGKAKRTLKKSKSLRTGGGNVKKAQTDKQLAKQKLMAAGKGDQNDAIAGLDELAKDILGL